MTSSLTSFTGRPSERAPDTLRAVTLETGVNRYAEGSCLVVVRPYQGAGHRQP